MLSRLPATSGAPTAPRGWGAQHKRTQARVAFSAARAIGESDTGPTPVEGTAEALPRPKPRVMPRAMPRRPPPGMTYGPDGNLVKVVKVEDVGAENPYAFEGVAQMDSSGDQPFSFKKLGSLVGGDVAAIVLFAIIGRINHGEILDIETLLTAAPFLVGWTVAASALGGYGKDAQYADTKTAALTAAKCWAVGTPAGLALRGLSKGYVPPTPFIIVSLVVTAVLLVGWRSAYAASGVGSAPAPSGNRQGNALEFLSLLGSLVRRW